MPCLSAHELGRRPGREARRRRSAEGRRQRADGRRQTADRGFESTPAMLVVASGGRAPRAAGVRGGEQRRGAGGARSALPLHACGSCLSAARERGASSAARLRTEQRTRSRARRGRPPRQPAVRGARPPLVRGRSRARAARPLRTTSFLSTRGARPRPALTRAGAKASDHGQAELPEISRVSLQDMTGISPGGSHADYIDIWEFPSRSEQ